MNHFITTSLVFRIKTTLNYQSGHSRFSVNVSSVRLYLNKCPVSEKFSCILSTKLLLKLVFPMPLKITELVRIKVFCKFVCCRLTVKMTRSLGPFSSTSSFAVCYPSVKLRLWTDSLEVIAVTALLEGRRAVLAHSPHSSSVVQDFEGRVR